MVETPNKQYLDVIANAFQAKQAWKTACLVLAGVVAFLTFSLVYQSRNTPVVLVPFELATAGKRMEVAVNGEIKGTSSEYMANVALGDLGLILNFTPDNVLSQNARFMNRLTESLYGQQRESLIVSAEDNKRRSVTQSFFVSNVSVRADGKQVEVTGVQLRWLGGKETLRNSVTYVLSYSVSKGYPHVSDLRKKDEVEAK
jgi:type IV conjugative transfer system protein TraE